MVRLPEGVCTLMTTITILYVQQFRFYSKFNVLMNAKATAPRNFSNTIFLQIFKETYNR